MVEEMAYRAPELRDRMQYPRSRNSLYHWVQASREACKPEAAVNRSRPVLSSDEEEVQQHAQSARVGGEPLIALFDTCFEAGRLLGLEQGQFPEFLSKEDFPYFQHKLARGCEVISSKKVKPSSKPNTSQRRAVVGSSVTNSGTKGSRCFQESQLDTVHPGNDPKRPRTAGNFGIIR
ncbi:uncharacterized protein [Miscanthus floridulus]|uniref:uncharacterized protein n=1 Tax=Miscanthus floridulus TaxID=154761 RepID=UPI0034594C97